MQQNQILKQEQLIKLYNQFKTHWEANHVKSSVKSVFTAEKFLAISMSHNEKFYTIFTTTNDEFNKTNKDQPTKYRQVKATKRKIQALIEHNEFYVDVNNNLNILVRAKIYLSECF